MAARLDPGAGGTPCAAEQEGHSLGENDAKSQPSSATVQCGVDGDSCGERDERVRARARGGL